MCRQVAADGTVHEVTSGSLTFLTSLTEYTAMCGNLLCSDGSELGNPKVSACVWISDGARGRGRSIYIYMQEQMREE